MIQESQAHSFLFLIVLESRPIISLSRAPFLGHGPLLFSTNRMGQETEYDLSYHAAVNYGVIAVCNVSSEAHRCVLQKMMAEGAVLR